MPRSLASPEHLFDRTWRPGHPFRPRLSRARRIAMALLLLLLVSIIGGYVWITDSNRVRRLTEDYLSRLVGGRVRVGDATLSIFQGLRLNDVRVYTDKNESADALIFRAQVFDVRVNGPALLAGNVEATQIVAIEPHVRLVEDTDTHNWNFQHLRRPDLPSSPRSDHPPVLPEVTLRNAIVEYGEGAAGAQHTRGTVAIEGQLQPVPNESNAYLFKLQSRGGESQDMGPSVEGKLDMSSGAVTASLRNFRFGADLEAMLPRVVRDWWKQHEITGSVDLPELSYRPDSADASQLGTFRAEIDPRDVDLVVHSDELMSTDELKRQSWLQSSLQAMRGAGFAPRFVNELQTVVSPVPIQLKRVSGKFVFTKDRIDIQDLWGNLESNGIKINGHINNYSEPSKRTASIRVSSMDTSDVLIPASPRYINSMPQPVREIYDHLRPQGHARFWIQLDQPLPDSHPQVEGEIEVLNGSFVFDKFPYPIDGATGRLVFGKNPKTGQEQLEITDVKGHGPAKGPNDAARVNITGLVSPFGAESGIKVTVIGEDVVSEPLLFNAFPIATQQALKMFDAPGKGQLPKFRGGFTCEIERPEGLDKHWDVVTKIRLDDAQGSLVAFPYPMSGVSGELTVTDDAVKISHAVMQKNGATLQIDGVVSWHDEGVPQVVAENLTPAQRMLPPVVPEVDRVPPLRPELHVVAKNVPIDSDLLEALPADQRAWLARAGLAGRFDLDGEVSRGLGFAQPTDEIGFDFAIQLHDGALKPVETAGIDATNLSGAMRFTPGKLVVESLQAKRGEAELSARGSASWQNPTAPELAISAEATNLSLDSALHDALPPAAKDAWDEVQPHGSLDLSLTYSGTVGATNSSGAKPSFDLKLTPRTLSATPKVVPYKLDQLGGSISISPQKIVLNDITAKHGDATIKLAGAGSSINSPINSPSTAPTTSPSTAPTNLAATTWDLHLSADKIKVDDDLITAVPSSLADLIKSLSLHGNLGFDFDRLLIAPSSTPGKGANVDFAMQLRAQSASLDVGVPITDVQAGTASFAGITQDGKLSQLVGEVRMPSLKLAGRPSSDFRAALEKPANMDLLRISKIDARLADGEIAGQFDTTIGDAQPQRFAMSLVLRNADVKQLTGEGGADFRGTLSASLALEGNYDNPATRRGRGDVTVNGEKLYSIPLVLGLLQITNLALPITSPFNEATARYSVDGSRVSFENIELIAKDMQMQGSGHLDFATKQVRLTFVTDNTTWPKLPIIGDLIQGARHELLQIHVKGTLQDPKVSAGAFGTVTTTVDEVLKGGEGGDAYIKKR